MTFAVYVGIGFLYVFLTLWGRMKVRIWIWYACVCCCSCGFAVVVAEVVFLVVATHTMVSLINWSHSPTETYVTYKPWRPSLTRISVLFHFDHIVAIEESSSAGLLHATFTEAAWCWWRRQRSKSDKGSSQRANTPNLKSLLLQQSAFMPDLRQIP